MEKELRINKLMILASIILIVLTLLYAINYKIEMKRNKVFRLPMRN